MKQHASSASSPGGERRDASILIVEDEAIVAMDLRSRLADLGHAVCGIADTAARAVQLAREATPDLVLMDIRLKGGDDGIAAAEEIRRNADLPVVFVSAYTDDATVGRAVRAEPDGFLTKPFDERTLAVTIQTALIRRAAAAARASEQLSRIGEPLAGLFDAFPDPLILIDAGGRVVLLNRRAQSLLGRTCYEFVGRPLETLVRCTARPRSPTSPLELGGPEQDERYLEGVLSDGTTVSLKTVSLRTWGRPNSITGIVIREERSDVDERSAIARTKAGRHLAGLIAGELTPPIREIASLARRVVSKLAADDDARGDARSIVDLATRLRRTTEELRKVARAPSKRERIDANALVASLAGVARWIAGPKIEVQIRPASSPLWIEAESVRLTDALLELLIRAARATREGGGIGLSVVPVDVDGAQSPLGVRAGRYVVIEVRDGGGAMAPVALDRLFEPGAESWASEGALCLAIALSAARSVGGALELSSNPATGDNTVSLYLPRAARDGRT